MIYAIDYAHLLLGHSNYTHISCEQNLRLYNTQSLQKFMARLKKSTRVNLKILMHLLIWNMKTNLQRLKYLG